MRINICKRYYNYSLIAAGDRENIFHLHGYSFYVVGYRQFAEPVKLERIKEMDENGELFKRNLMSPAYKDTIRIPKFGVVAIRFIASNPGNGFLQYVLLEMLINIL